MKTVAVVGIGSAAGDDCIGWVVTDALQARLARMRIAPPLRIDIAKSRGLPAELAERFEGAVAAILVDGIRSDAGNPGTLHRLDRAAIERQPPSLSSHGVALADALQLVEALAHDPPRIVLYGIEIARCSPATGLTPAVAGAIPAVVERILAEIGVESRAPDALAE